MSQAISRNAQALVQEAKAKHAELFPDNTGSPKSKCDFSISVSGEKQNKFEDQKLDEEQNQDYLETVSLVSQKILNDNNSISIFQESRQKQTQFTNIDFFTSEFFTQLIKAQNQR